MIPLHLLERTSQPIPILHYLYLLQERYALHAILSATSRSVTKMTIATLGATPRANNLHAITVRAGKSIMLLNETLWSGSDCIPSGVKQCYSSHIAPIRKSVVADAWIALSPNPLLSVAGVTISPPGAATHLKVARWLSGTSSISPPDVYVGSVV